jgi:pimeloyl-ACP methyl ester carboxylesterase
MAPPTSTTVLLHGVGLDATMWEPVQAELAGPTLALELPGHGSRPALRAEQSLSSLAEDVLRRMPEEPVHLVGFSLGALIAQHIARYASHRVKTLTSVSSVCQRTPEEAAAVEQRLQTAQQEFEAGARAAIARWFPVGTEVPFEVVDRVKSVLLANDRESYRHAYAVFARGDRDIGDELSAISCPSLAITGELDPGSTPEMSRRLAEAIPECRLTVVPQARHMLPIENAPAVAAAVRYLAQASPDAGEGENGD